MAKEEKENNVPALIDYGSGCAQPDEGASSTELRKYWEDELSRLHRTGTIPWSIKDKTLWKRLIKQYGSDRLYLMIDEWFKGSSKPANFPLFYHNAPAAHKRTQPKDYGWN